MSDVNEEMLAVKRRTEATAKRMMAELHKALRKKGLTPDDQLTIMVNSVGRCCAEVLWFAKSVDQGVGSEGLAEMVLEGLNGHIENAVQGRTPTKETDGE